MARGRGRGKYSCRSNPAIRVSMPTIPMPTIVSPQQGGTPTIVTSTQSISPTISEAPPATQNQNNLIGQGLSTQSNPSDHTNTVAATTNQSNVISQGMSSHSNPIDHTNTVAATPNQSNVIGQGLSPQSSPTYHTNTTAEGESSNSHTRTLVFITHAGNWLSFQLEAQNAQHNLLMSFIIKCLQIFQVKNLQNCWAEFQVKNFQIMCDLKISL